MIDQREQILVRVREVLPTIAGLALDSTGAVRGVGRNRTDISGKARPAIIMHDGQEERDDTKTGGPRRSEVQVMKMTPRFVILVGTETEQVGTATNVLRSRLLTALLTDSQLIAMTGGGNPSSGGMIYEGCEMDSEPGETREARMIVHFTFGYAFRVADLTAP